MKKRNKKIKEKVILENDLDTLIEEFKEKDSKIPQSDKDFFEFKKKIEIAIKSEEYSLQDIESIFQIYSEYSFYTDPTKKDEVSKYNSSAIARYKRGLAIAKLSKSLNPKDEYLFHTAIGNRYVDLEKYDEVIKEYKEALKVNETLDLHIKIADILGDQRKLEESLKYFDEITLKPDAKIFFHKGNILFALKRYEEAIENLNEAFKLLSTIDIGDYDYIMNDLYTEILLIQSKCFYELQKYRESIKKTKTLVMKLHSLKTIKESDLIIKKKLSEAYFITAKSLLNLGVYKEAMSLLTDAISLGINDSYIYQAMAATSLQLGIYEDSIKFSLLALKIEKDDIKKSENYFNIGAAYYKMGELQNSITFFQKAINLNKLNLKVYEYIAKLLSSEKKYHEANTIYEKLINYGLDDKTDFSFLDKVISSDEIDKPIYLKPSSDKSTLAEPEENLANDDIEYISSSFNLYETVEKLTLDYISSNIEEGKDKYKQKLLFIVTNNPLLESFIINLFENFDNKETALTTLTDIFAQENPTLIHKFFQNKKAKLLELKDNPKISEIIISDELEGIHKINTPKSFKGEWFFKFSRAIIYEFKDTLFSIKHKINDLRILKADSTGKEGFKKHEIKTGETHFNMLKLVLGEDVEQYATKTTKCLINDKIHILSEIDSYRNHVGMEDLINGTAEEHFSEKFVEQSEFLKIIGEC